MTIIKRARAGLKKNLVNLMHLDPVLIMTSHKIKKKPSFLSFWGENKASKRFALRHAPSTLANRRSSTEFVFFIPLKKYRIPTKKKFTSGHIVRWP